MAIVVRNLNVRGKVVVGPPVVIPSGPATQGPNFPSSASDRSFGDDTWDNADKVYVCDNTSADCVPIYVGSYMNFLQIYNFGFTIPTGAVIDGIEITIKAKSTTNNDGFGSITLWRGLYNDNNYGGSFGSIVGSPIIISLTTSYVTYTVGGPTNKWNNGYGDWGNQNITAEDINQNGGIEFGFVLGGDAHGGTVSIDCATMKVYYTI